MKLDGVFYKSDFILNLRFTFFQSIYGKVIQTTSLKKQNIKP
jgi:hypothetical protein